MRLRVKFRAENQHRPSCRYFRRILLFWWSIFDGTNIHRTAIYGKTFLTQWSLTLFPVTCVKNVLCNVVGFTIVHFSEAATGGVLLEKVFLEISQNSQKNTSDLFRVFSRRFLVYFIPTEKWNEKRETSWRRLIPLLSCSSIDSFGVKDFKRNLADGNLIRKCV